MAQLSPSLFTTFIDYAAFMWSKKHLDTTKEPLLEVLNPFLVYIRFHMIPANILMTEIHPLGLVPYRDE